MESAVTVARTVMLGTACDRCTKRATLYAYRGPPTYRGRKKIVKPWLCSACYTAERGKRI